MPENFQVLAALNEIYFFHSTTLFVVTKNPSQSSCPYNIWQISSSLWWNAFFHATNYNFKPGIVSYPNYWKTLPSMSQLIHKCRKNHAINSSRHLFPAALLVKRCTLPTFSSTKQRGVSPLLSQVEISLLNEQASKKLTRLVTATKILKQSIVKCHPLHNHPSPG